MNSVSVAAWFEAFVLTYAIEAAIVVPMLRAAEPSLARRAALCFFANLATHPAVWFIIPRLGLPDPATIAVAEAWAFGLEGVFYALVLPKLGAQRAMFVSIAANATSYAIGIVLHAVGLLN
jgi:hypothetical protein